MTPAERAVIDAAIDVTATEPGKPLRVAAMRRLHQAVDALDASAPDEVNEAAT